MKESRNIQDPQDDSNDNNCVENRLDGCLHWNEAIHQPQNYAHHDQDFYKLDQRHDFDLSHFGSTPLIREALA